MNRLAIVVDPLSIACVMLMGKGFHSDYPSFPTFGLFDGQLYFLICLMHQQFLGTAVWSDKLSIDGYNGVTNLHMDARGIEWRSRVLVPGITLNNMGNAIALSIAVIVPIYTQKPLAVMGAMAIFSPSFVGM